MGRYLVAIGMEDRDAPIEIVDLTIRTYNCLKRAGIGTIRQFISFRKQELSAPRNLTPFFHLPGVIRQELDTVEVELRPFNDRRYNQDLVALCERINAAPLHLPDGRRLCFWSKRG